MAFEPERLSSSSTRVSQGDLTAQVLGTALGSDQLTVKSIPCVDQLPGEEFSFTARNSWERIVSFRLIVREGVKKRLFNGHLNRKG